MYYRQGQIHEGTTSASCTGSCLLLEGARASLMVHCHHLESFNNF